MLLPAETLSLTPSPLLFCASCTETLSSSCLISGVHRDHQLIALDDAVPLRLEKLTETVKKLLLRVKKCGDIRAKTEAAEHDLEMMCELTQEVLQKEYRALMELLEQNQQQAFRLLNAHKETMRQKLHQLSEDAQNYQEKSNQLIENIQELNNRTDSEKSASLLGEISAMETSLDTMNEFYSTVNDKLKLDNSRLKALKGSVNKIVEMNRKLLPRPWEFSEKITLDSKTKPENMHISEDGTEMWMAARPSGAGGKTPAAGLWCSVLASQKFKKGQHYWEINVGGSRSWVVGVVERCHGDKETRSQALGHDKSSWVLECDDGEILAMHNDEFSDVKEDGVQTLGVFLDCDKGRVKFFNVATGTMLHIFIANFKRPMIPTFSIKPKESTARLKICKLSDEEESSRATYECDSGSFSELGSSSQSKESSLDDIKSQYCTVLQTQL